MISEGTEAHGNPGSASTPSPIPLESLAEELRRKFLEARVNADEIHRAEREFRSYEEKALRDELDRMRAEFETERLSWRDEVAALHDAWEAERRGWREQLEAAHRQAHLERDNARAVDAKLRVESELHARHSLERDARSHSFEALIANVLRDADDRLVRLNDLRRERDDLRDEIEAIGAGRGLTARASESGNETEALRAERDELSHTRDVLQLALDDAEAAARLSATAHAERLAEEEAKVAVLNQRIESLRGAESSRKNLLPILSRDLARWSTPPPLPPEEEVIPQTPPSADDLAAAERQVEMLRKLIRIPAVPGRPLHTLFDEARYVTLQSRLREASLLAERLFSQVERSRSSKDLLWHLMVAQRTEEINRNKRR